MQHLNDDMDGLFQRAADNYPLDPGPDSWRSILDEVNTQRHAERVKQKAERSITLLGMVLLTLVFSSGLFIVLKNNGIAAGSQAIYKGHDVNEEMSGSSKNDIQPTRPGFTKGKAVTEIPGNKNAFPSGVTQAASTKTLNDFEGSINKRFSKDRPVNQDATLPLQSRAADEEQASTYDKANAADTNVEEAKQRDNKTTAAPELLVKKESKKPRYNHRKSFYLGALAGADFSRVKSMPFNSAGLSAGIYVELKLTPVWSLQTALIINKKNYVGQGEDFSMDKVKDAMTGMTITNVQSRSTLIELPLAAKLYLKRNRIRGAFITAGLSSYIMTSEKNQYDVMHNGSPEKFNGYYKANTYNGFAAATFSIGYQNKLSRNTELNIAPYLNIPLKGIGVGSLPVTSAGIRVSIGTRVR